MTTKLETLILKEAKKYEGMPVALSGGIDSSLLAALVKPRFVISVELPEDDRFNEIQYSKIVAEHLGLEHIIIKLDHQYFEEHVKEAVRAIGRPIPHFNIFPLYTMYAALAEMGETDLILGDGPDETMAGYARDLIASYLYKVYDFEAFEDYKDTINKILPPLTDVIKILTGKDANTMLEADIMSRVDMDNMSDRIAKHFGIINHRPYQDNLELDKFMAALPEKQKIYKVEYGKYALRKIAEKYLPKEIAWRKKKVGGPVYQVNKMMGWDKEEGDFGKTKWIQYQQSILDEALHNSNRI